VRLTGLVSPVPNREGPGAPGDDLKSAGIDDGQRALRTSSIRA
jgi:hypothetical protein